MLKYGVVEPEGAQGYGTVRIGMRAPRVAVRVESRSDWQSLFALAMWVASGLWGGYGFIYLPRGEGPLHPALARILTAYDPDYLVDALWTFGDVEALDPGWHARRVPDWPSDPEESAAALARSADMKVNTSGDDIGADRCSPFYDLPDDRSTRVLWEQDDGHAVHQLATLLGSGARRAEFEVPEGLDPLLMLALGMRAGYASKPTLPLAGAAEGPSDRLPQEYIGYALSVEGRPSIRHLGSLTTAWSLTRTGLVQIGKIRPLARPVAVIGSTADDFALAVALDRMFGMTAWIPAEWTQDSALRWQVNLGLHGLVNGSRYTGHPPIVTSISLPPDALNASIESAWPGLVTTSRGAGGAQHALGDRPPEVVAPEALDLQSPTHLACAGDFDLPFSSPTRADGRGGVEFLLPLPVFTPRSDDLRGPRRPFWEVDVEAIPQRMPSGRNLRSHVMLAEGESYPAVARSGRDGISLKPMNMLFVPGGATLEQSVARPRLRVPGLRGWIEALAAQDHPEMSVELSQAGRRAMILARLWGSRSAVSADLLALNDFLREFRPSKDSDSDSGSYPQGDGVRLTPAEGYLTFAAAVRKLGKMEHQEIRERVNRLIDLNVLQRGLVVPCSECERRAFYRIGTVAEKNACPRCGASAYATSGWRSGTEQAGEPGWFYDLHGAVRELLEQNGDVPFLAGWALAKTARSFEDIPELDFHWPGTEKPDEIDIAALVDGRMVIGEAKCVASLGTRKETNKAVQKLIRVSDLVGADEIVLATTASGPWEDLATSQLVKAVAAYGWRFGTTPRIRVLTDLRNAPQNTILS